ncbi:class I SAM-dependent methyltransferase [Parvicella tangerina]|uniref:Methyltransferase domain-containing protein n=1 Tax=Parvicella tangerina TaxID=2829795 RepID=A0A916JLD0_9FLAO|nr:class I SAM-dependent methyltransferase [Parvicella tangerina]CAG5080650.1 hypothetical protein CRYO30217_01408 [Parvicella tangerina]
MLTFWNERYAEPSFAYGEGPNEFFKQELDQLTPGKILLPAEGEGRNAVYAAKKGWDVHAFDQSEEGRKKAFELAKKNHVSINFQLQDLNELDYPNESFDCIALIYVHTPPASRRKTHQNLCKLLKPNGTLILEGFHKDHINYNSKNPKAGGPKAIDLLFSIQELQEDFCGMNILQLEETITHLNEGNYHVGESAVVRMVAKKMS